MPEIKNTLVKSCPRSNDNFCNEILFLLSRMYSNCSGPGFALHSDIVMPYISKYGSREQIERFVPEMTAGKCIGAIAMTEPGAGRSGLERRCNISIGVVKL